MQVHAWLTISNTSRELAPQDGLILVGSDARLEPT